MGINLLLGLRDPVHGFHFWLPPKSISWRWPLAWTWWSSLVFMLPPRPIWRIKLYRDHIRSILWMITKTSIWALDDSQGKQTRKQNPVSDSVEAPSPQAGMRIIFNAQNGKGGLSLECLPEAIKLTHDSSTWGGGELFTLIARHLLKQRVYPHARLENLKSFGEPEDCLHLLWTHFLPVCSMNWPGYIQSHHGAGLQGRPE